MENTGGEDNKTNFQNKDHHDHDNSLASGYTTRLTIPPSNYIQAILLLPLSLQSINL